MSSNMRDIRNGEYHIMKIELRLANGPLVQYWLVSTQHISTLCDSGHTNCLMMEFMKLFTSGKEKLKERSSEKTTVMLTTASATDWQSHRLFCVPGNW